MLARDNKRAVNWFLIIIYLISFGPWVEISSAIAKTLDQFYVSWNYLAMILGIITMEIDILFYTRIQRTDSWRLHVQPVIDKIFQNNQPKKAWRLALEKLIIKLEYLGLLIGASIPGLGLGKVVSLIFTTSRKKFRYGRILLYLGCIIRVYVMYHFYDQFF